MSENVYSAPESNLNLSRSTDVQLWNPDAAGAWSLLFTPIFGSILVYKNWKTIGDVEQADKAKKWIYISVFMSVVSAVVGVLGIIYICTWYFMSQKKQTIYFKNEYGGKYTRKSWKKPLLIAFSIWLGIIMAIVVVASSLTSA